MNGPELARWHTARRGVTFVLFSMLSVVLLPITAGLGLAMAQFQLVPPGLLLVPFGVVLSLYPIGLIQCATVPDAQARGLMLGACAGVGAHCLLGFAQMNPSRIVFSGRAMDWLLALAPVLHGLIVVAGIFLLVLYARRIAKVFAHAELARTARLLTNSLLGWSGTILGIVLALAFIDNRLEILHTMILVVVGLSLMAVLPFLFLFVCMLASARDVLAGAHIDTRSIL